MKSDRSKVLHTLLGRPMLSYVLDAVAGASFHTKIVICGKNEAQLRETYADEGLTFVRQPMGEGVPYGTGFAVMQAVPHLTDGPVLIVAGDVPLVRAETLVKLVELHTKKGNTATVLTAELDDTTGYGRIIKDMTGQMQAIVEDRDCTPEQKKIREVNSGIFVVQSDALVEALDTLTDDNDQKEYYITDIFKWFNQKARRIGTMLLDDASEMDGVNSKWQLAQVENTMRKRILHDLAHGGVIFENPDTICVGPLVKIGRDTRIEQNVRIVGNTSIGEDCVIGQGSVIRDCTLGNGVRIRASELEESVVEDGADLGPYAHLRPKAHIGAHAHLGNFVEVKNATLGPRTKAGHLAYIGDADLGADVNIGCGVVFVNYDGTKKHRATVEDKAFVGSNANVVAPVTIGRRAYVAAGSTITKDVAPDSLAIERAKQTQIDGWVERKFGKEDAQE